MRKALYVGSFDPPTVGHAWMIERGAELFDELVVGVAVNADKKHFLSITDRVLLLEKIAITFPNVSIATLGAQFTALHAPIIGARYLLRGVRSLDDESYELLIARVNHDIRSDLTTIMIPAPLELRDVSSSLVRKLVGPDRWDEVIAQYVPSVVLDRLRECFPHA